MTGNPKLFLSRTGYREVDAATSGSASQLSPGADINGVLFTGASNIIVTAAADTLTGNTLAPNVLFSDLTSVGTLTNLTVTNPMVGSITGNSATVTTNANLTGPISSAGNTTSITSQTGTGTTFAMQNSPVFITPDIGAATGASLTLGGNISTDAGTTNWLLGDYTVTPPAATGFITVTINGTPYKLLTST